MHWIDNTPIEIEKGEPSEPILVIAPNQMEFVKWCVNHRLNHTSSSVRYAWRLDQIKGLKDGWFVLIDGVYKEESKYLARFTGELKALGFKEIPRNQEDQA